MQVEIESHAVILVFGIVLAMEALSVAITRCLDLKPSERENDLSLKIQETRIEAENNNFPATFMRWAELSRKANKLEIQLESLKEERLKEAQKPWRKTAKKIIQISRYGLLLCIYALSNLFCDREMGLVQFKNGALTPLSWTYSIGLLSSSEFTAVGPFSWAFLCQRVLRRISNT